MDREEPSDLDGAIRPARAAPEAPNARQKEGEETMSDLSTELGELTISRIFEARPEVVFECMTTPSHLTHFWGPVGVSTPLEGITVEPRPGGRFETVMVNDETGEEFPLR